MDTKYLKIQDENDINKIKMAAYILRDGGLVAIPTETVYGLGANALDENAVKNIFIAKGRPQDNPLIVHIYDASEVNKYAYDIDEKALKLFEKFWPGPLTVILKKLPIIPDVVSAGLDTVALRCPSHKIAREIIKEAGVPIAAPSANISGKPSPTKAQHVLDDLNGKIDMIVDGGECSIGVESTVISLAWDKPVLLRPGAISLEQLQEILGEVLTDKAIFEKVSISEKVSAPGMKYRHYAPKAKVVAIMGDYNETTNYIKQQILNEKYVGVMCYNGEEQLFKGAYIAIPYGDADNPLSLAQNLFEVLREFDKTDTKIIYARCPKARGVYLAVFNRIIKAAGFELISF